MWFWSVSWSTNCLVYLSFFWSTKKNLFSLREYLVSLWIFLLRLWFFGILKRNFGIPNRNLVDKKNQRLTKNSLWLDNLFLVDQKKWEKDQTIGRPRDWPKPHGQDYWLTKNSLRLDSFFLVGPKKWEKDRTIGRPRDWPKPHGRDLYELHQLLPRFSVIEKARVLKNEICWNWNLNFRKFDIRIQN